MGKILAIKERQPVETKLPDGNYTGIWGGYVITIYYNSKTYELTTDEGVRGTGFKVIVTIKDGIGTYTELNN